MKYYLLALYKTIKTGQTHYWKQDLLGCTTELKEAGLFEVREVIKLKVEYFHGRTVLVEEEIGKKLVRLEEEPDVLIRQSYEHNGEKFSILHLYQNGKLKGIQEIPYDTPKHDGELIMPRIGVNDKYYELIKNNPMLRYYKNTNLFEAIKEENE